MNNEKKTMGATDQEGGQARGREAKIWEEPERKTGGATDAGETEVKKSRRKVIVLVVIMLVLLVGVGVTLALILPKQMEDVSGAESGVGDNASNDEEAEMAGGVDNADDETAAGVWYSPLTGLPVGSEAETVAPTFCVQVPNGTDGARPQAGLDKAGVIFEAIAERGITRFAAIYQNVGDIVAIGPMRSLRMYFLQWDVPFDCTVVHDGGADDALAAVRSYKDFTSFSGYVWRSASSSLNRRWNNEFTSGQMLLDYNAKKGYGNSEVNGFLRLTPEAAQKERFDTLAVNPLDIDTETDLSTSELKMQATSIQLKFGSMPNYNPTYTYDAESNTYKRGYASGAEHKIYDCDGQSGKVTPENVCGATQLAPSVVIAMEVEEHVASDNYHENITVIGEGTAYIFEGGMVKEATWKKTAIGTQIKFYDKTGQEIALAPGQTIVSAVPQYGSIAWE